MGFKIYKWLRSHVFIGLNLIIEPCRLHFSIVSLSEKNVHFPEMHLYQNAVTTRLLRTNFSPELKRSDTWPDTLVPASVFGASFGETAPWRSSRCSGPPRSCPQSEHCHCAGRGLCLGPNPFGLWPPVPRILPGSSLCPDHPPKYGGLGFPHVPGHGCWLSELLSVARHCAR